MNACLDEGCRIKVEDRNDWHAFKGDALGFLHDFEALLLVCCAGGFFHEKIVLPVAPAALVVCAARFKKLEEGVRVDIVANPPAAANVVIALIAGCEEVLPLLVEKANVDV